MPRRGRASLFAIPAFLAVYLVLALTWHVPSWIAPLYLAASGICFVAYAADKSAAVAGRRRVPEKTLLLLGWVGGWPGAIVAQHVVRHKLNKASFRVAFWVSVVGNLVAFIGVSSPFMPVFRT